MIIRLYSLGSIGKTCNLSTKYISHHGHSLKPVFGNLAYFSVIVLTQKQYNYSRILNLFLPNEIRKLIGKKIYNPICGYQIKGQENLNKKLYTCIFYPF